MFQYNMYSLKYLYLGIDYNTNIVIIHHYVYIYLNIKYNFI